MYLRGENKKMNTNQNGITLIALVVTIVVLLILAGITINMLFSENGIITKAREAADKTAQAEKDESEGMTGIVDQINSIVNSTFGSITLNQIEVEMTHGTTIILTPTVKPEGTKVTWTSSDENILTVENGVVTAVGVGEATITATATELENKKAECKIKVNEQIGEGISLNQTSATIVAGQTVTLTATIMPENTTNKNVTWSTNNESVATVSNGVVTAVGVGEAVITVTTADGSNQSAECTVTVTPQLATSISLSKTTAELEVGGTVTLTPTVMPENATNKNVTWSTNNESVATVSNGVVTAVGEGEAIITATTADGSNLSAKCTVTVKVEALAMDFSLLYQTMNSARILLSGTKDSTSLNQFYNELITYRFEFYSGTRFSCLYGRLQWLLGCRP